LALQTAFQRLKGLRRRPEPDRLLKLVEPWRPYRGAGAHFLWHFYAAPPMD
jgi:DNA-3-methyladenine glycosylase II